MALLREKPPENELSELEESFYCDQEYLKTMWDESERSANHVKAIQEKLDTQETNIKRCIMDIYSKSMSEKFNLIGSIFKTEKEHMDELNKSLNYSRDMLQNFPDVDQKNWKLDEQEKVIKLRKLPVQLMVNGEIENAEENEVVMIQPVIIEDTPEKFPLIHHNPEYPKFNLASHSSEPGSSTPFSEEIKSPFPEPADKQARLEHETEQWKMLLKQEVDKLDSEQATTQNVMANNKTICSNLSENPEEPQQKLSSTSSILEVVNCSSSNDASLPIDVEKVDSRTNESEVRIKELELELANTKLALAKEKCKNQEIHVASSSFDPPKYRGKYNYHEINEKELPLDSYSQIILGTYGDPSYFFLVKECSKAHIKQLQDALDHMDVFYHENDIDNSVGRNLQYKSGSNIQDYVIKMPSVGQPCAFKDDDGKYGRAKILNVKPASIVGEDLDILPNTPDRQISFNEETLGNKEPAVTIFEVDDGNVSEYLLKNIRQIPEKYLEVHTMAIPAKLTGIKPLNRNGKWSDECLKYFERLFGSKATIYADKRVSLTKDQRILRDGLPTTNILSVTLFQEEESNGERKLRSINEKLVEMGFAELESNSGRQLSEITYYRNLPEHIPQKGAIDLEDTIRQSDYRCNVLSGYSPNYWYVSFVHGMHNDSFDSQEYAKMQDDLNKYYMASNTTIRRLKTIYEAENENEDGNEHGIVYNFATFKVGDLVTLRRGNEYNWSRGKVLEMVDYQSRANVLLVDKGVIEFSVPIEDLERLVERFTTVDSNVYCVALYGVNYVDMSNNALNDHPFKNLEKKEQLFNYEMYLRVCEGELQAGKNLTNVMRSAALDCTTVKMILKGSKGTPDPFGSKVPYQKDAASYLISKGIATDASSWQPPAKSE